jgi:hypothetical protein
MALPSVEWKTVLGINGELWSAVLRYEGNPLPGSTFPARVNLLYPNKCLALFTLGAHFTVWEGETKAEGYVTAFKDD